MILISLLISLISLVIAVIALLLQIKSNKQIKNLQKNQIEINKQIEVLHQHIDEAEGNIRMSV
ncbi:hypothetical protein ES703_122808 [subsurface metagenome]